MDKVAIIGTTSWGITIGLLLAAKGTEVRLWARTEREAKKLRKKGVAPPRFSGVPPPPQIVITSHLAEAAAEADAAVIAVPSPTMRQNISLLESYLGKSTLVGRAPQGRA